jgi:thiamine pyrophosphate-dependent acetolactate synthase large subunit-like protein
MTWSDTLLGMVLGCLATIANVKPRNLTIIIWNNGIYQITGKQMAATGGATDIVAVARGAGIAKSEWVRAMKRISTR